MKYGIIAHINSDIIALKAALHKMESAKVELVVCAGNVVEKPNTANDCVDVLREWGFPTVLGNHDAVACGSDEPWGFKSKSLTNILMTREGLSDKNRIWMQGLPCGLLFTGFAVVHGNAGASRVYRNKWEYLMEHWPYPDRERGKACFIAHPDKPGVYSPSGELPLDEDGKLLLDTNTNVFIAPGRVGRSGNKDPWSTFGIFDTEERSYQQVYLNLAV
ncbi:MAG: metallophosphatase family protein [Candidatus Hydrogenedentes bacterium]|nr:metallophosphatase family protein [Candidatus Hydrogenedentota bacterium]